MTEAVSASPSAWAQAYVGLPYIVGVGECAHRAALVWRREFGFEVEPPSAFGDLRAAQRHVLAELRKPDWARVARPAEGDAVVMLKGDLVCHVGVWVAPGHVLHCTRARGMVLTSVEDLPEEGFRVFGFFRRQAVEAVEARAA
jgi:hypothetical protein